MASSAKSEYPQFLDGDALLILSTTQTYKLHSQVLSTHSKFFADEIAAKPAVRLTAQARREHAAAYRFEYVPSVDRGEPGKWVRKDLNEQGRPPRGSAPLLPDFDNGKAENNVYQAWEWLFGIFYNREPSFVNDSLATVLNDVVVLIECAESIGAVEHIRDIVDLALLRQDHSLWTSIMGNPVAWLELGRRVCSATIFTEAAVHLVGQWGILPADIKDSISDDLREFLDKKANDVELAKEGVELRILGHYPHFMLRTAAEKPGRPSYSGDIYMWMAVCFFRQWFAQSISDDRTRRAPDGGMNFYTALHEGGQAYLTHLDFQEFHRYFPMSIKACHVLEANMGVLKEDVKKFVGDLMIERTHLKRADYPSITWLTCCKIEKEEVPWEIPTPRTRDDDLRDMYEQLDNENNALFVPDHGKSTSKRKGKAAATNDDGDHTPSRPRKRARVMDGDDEEFIDPNDDDDFDDGTGLFIPERPDFVLRNLHAAQAEAEDETEADADADAYAYANTEAGADAFAYANTEADPELDIDPQLDPDLDLDLPL